MSLTVKLKNIGILKQAEFSLGDLTLICGENNTGKTYAACALYGFLESWRKFIRFPISDAQIQQARAEPIKIDLAQTTDDMFTDACKKYTEQHDSIVIEAARFKGPFAVFNEDLENIRKRADFVIVSNDERERKWVICLETKGGNKTRSEVVAQL